MMVSDITPIPQTGISQFRFEELLSHTFPGFFLAFTIFMLLDIWSPEKLTQWVFSSLSTFLATIGFIILMGTVLGILTDGIRHWLIEKTIFNNLEGYKEINEELNNILPKNPKRDTTYYYYFNKIGKENYAYLIEGHYHYVEFYANAFVSVIPFSFIAPYYLESILKISWTYSFWLGAFLFILAWVSLHASYDAYLEFHRKRLDLLYGYLGCVFPCIPCIKGIEVVSRGTKWDMVKITAQLKDNDWKNIKEQDVTVDFRTSSEKLIESSKTKSNGMVETVVQRPKEEMVITAKVGSISGSTVVKGKE